MRTARWRGPLPVDLLDDLECLAAEQAVSIDEVVQGLLVHHLPLVLAEMASAHLAAVAGAPEVEGARSLYRFETSRAPEAVPGGPLSRPSPNELADPSVSRAALDQAPPDARP